MKSYISPDCYCVKLHGKCSILNMSIEIDSGENVDADDKTARQFFSVWDEEDM